MVLKLKNCSIFRLHYLYPCWIKKHIHFYHIFFTTQPKGGGKQYGYFPSHHHGYVETTHKYMNRNNKASVHACGVNPTLKIPDSYVSKTSLLSAVRIFIYV